MGKALKPFVVIVFLLSLVAVGLEVMIFQKREEFKGRMVKLERTTVEVARHLEIEDFRPDRLQDFEQMDGALRQVATMANDQVERRKREETEHEATRQTLATTQAELSDERAEHARTRNTLQETRETLAQRETELREARTQIASLEGDIRRLNTEIDEKNLEIARLNEEAEAQARELQLAQNAAQTWQRRFEAERDRRLGERARGPAQEVSGSVLLIDPEWRFVILSLGTEHGLAEGVEMLVSRDEEFVGRVRVSAVERNLSVADIVGAINVRTGDEVISPGS